MKNIYLLIAMIFSLPITLLGQLPTVNLDIRQGYFDGGNRLPGGERWRLAGQVPAGASAVRVEIGEKGNLFELADYSKEMNLYEEENGFEMLMDYPLKEGRNYDFRVVFGQEISKSESAAMQANLIEATEIYVDEVLYSNGNKIKLQTKPQEVFKRLNVLLNQYLMPFAEGGLSFSPSLLNHLKVLDGFKLKSAEYNVSPLPNDSIRTTKKIYFQAKSDYLKQSISSEIRQLGSTNKLKLMEEIDIESYPVEKSTFVLPINLGYAAVYNSGNFSDLQYDSAPYAGVSLPFGPRQIRDKLSISAGIFLQNFDFGDDVEVTGPVIGRPIYAALGFKALRLFRFNAGAAVLQSGSGSSANVFLRPMVGLAVEINVWAGFGKKN